MEPVAALAVGATPVARRRFAPWLVLIGALVIPCVYLPTLATPFDFIDDGNLVYPAPPMALGERLALVWEKVVANYEHLGPFRPVLWVHWELAAELFQADPVRWRAARLAWSALAVASLLALLRELGVRPLPALFAAALALWNPYRNEIWTSLTLSEGIAMPYALAALWCAARASRSRVAWPWEVASALGVLAAMGCKNIFAALVPVQMYLRVFAGVPCPRLCVGMEAQTCPRKAVGMAPVIARACVMALTLLLPIGHYAYYRLNWHAGQYPPGGPTMLQLSRMLRALPGAMSFDFLGVGLALALAAVIVAKWSGAVLGAGRYRTAWVAGGLLLLCGIAVYLPIPAMSGRYTMPAVWGLDLMLAAFLSVLAEVPAVRWRRAASVGLAVGLAVVALANVGRQEKFAARTELLWQTVHAVERTAVADTRVAWLSGPALNVEEGIHFRWHLLARGRGDVAVELFDEHGRPEERCELPAGRERERPEGWAVTGSPQPPSGGPWALRQSFRQDYWAGRRHFECHLWEHD
jgi:hypothetical protein